MKEIAIYIRKTIHTPIDINATNMWKDCVGEPIFNYIWRVFE